MIYVTEVKYPDDDDFHPLMRNEHQPEATCDKEDCMMQVQTMNDPKNKHYSGEYRVSVYCRSDVQPGDLAGAKQPPEDDEVETSDEGEGDSTPGNDLEDETNDEGEGDAKDAA